LVQNKLKVFVSGKENELAIERRAAIEAINSVGLLPMSSENRTASDKPIVDKYTNELMNSNIYVGIFGIKDSVPSRTEFNIAKDNKISRLVFEKKLNLNESRDKELQDFLTSIKDPMNGIVVSEFTDVFDLRNKIMDSLQQLLFDRFLESSKSERASQQESNETNLIPTSAPHILSINVKSDKAVYPVSSKVYLRVLAPFLLVGEPIIFEVRNSSQKIIFYQEMNPFESEMPKLREGNIYQTSFTMKKEDCKPKESMTIKAQHGHAYSYDWSMIDERNPVAQSDKSVYDWNSDMILTVVDPDANKDSMAEEYVGDRHDSKLIITSSKGKLEGYRLKETGKDTGIFQGILGIIGVSKDDTRQARTLNGQMIKTTQGTEVSDGFIECGEDEILKITYSNNRATAELTCFITKDLSSFYKKIQNG
jgi:hypothetical protein